MRELKQQEKERLENFIAFLGGDSEEEDSDFDKMINDEFDEELLINQQIHKIQRF